MNCINLLAFIQIAIAFDFGLLYFSNTHIFKALHKGFIKELIALGRKNVEEGKKICKEHEKTSKIPVRKGRADLADTLDKISYRTNPKNTNWGKYSYLGLYSGLYGLLCLLVIGLQGNSFDNVCQNFLLIFSEIVIVFEIFSMLQVRRVTDGAVSYLKVYKNMLILLAFMVLALICAATGLYFPLWTGFNITFVTFTILIVYMPVMVYVFRLMWLITKVKRLYKRCRTNITDFHTLIGRA